jgi:hypothetical protein
MARKMCVQIKGGLGNQLFQIVGLLHFSRELNFDPHYEINRYLRFSNRNLSIENIAKKLEIPRLINLHRPIYFSSMKEVSEFQFSSLKHNRPITFGNVILDGYFQHPEYLKNIYHELMPILAEECQKSLVSNCDCDLDHVTLHIRRGDYLKEENLNTFGVLNDSYFINILTKHSGAHIRIASDSAVNPNIIPKNAKNVEILGPNLSPWELLSYLANPRTLVMSNSSLSWWGAHIGLFLNPELKVISPETWFKKIPAAQVLINPAWERVPAAWM